MFSNTLINNFMVRMSNKTGSTLPRKKISKKIPKFSEDYIEKYVTLLLFVSSLVLKLKF